MKKLLVLVLALCLVLSGAAAFAELEIPRNETITENGNQCGALPRATTSTTPGRLRGPAAADPAC